MCGFAGLFDALTRTNDEDLRAVTGRMTETLFHRGPDDGGVWVDAAAGIGLGSRRLAIVDLSPEGHQPMASRDGRYVMAFNGEIYNFKAIRSELLPLGHKFRGHSDTEVMLAAISQWGLEKSLERFNGMFAFGLWDKSERLLHLVRDRLGEKPLYYGWMGKTLLFGSELKALRAHPAFHGEIDRNALSLYLRHNYIPAPYTIYQGIYKLLPGSVLTINPSAAGSSSKPIPYWSAKSVAEHGVAEPMNGSDQDAIASVECLLRDAVKLRMEADVPLGAFLSGGIDSSTVVALMQSQSDRPVKTFTIGFYEAGYNEAEDAKRVAAHLHTEHTELYVTAEEAMAVVPRIPTLYDEPFSDSSQIPTFLVSQLARRSVTVALSGDGGDELFGGYLRYKTGRDLWNKIAWIPASGRRQLSNAISSIPVEVLNNTLGWIEPVFAKYGRAGKAGDKLHKLSQILAMEEPETLYHRLVSHWDDPAAVALGAHEYPTGLTDRSAWANLPDLTQRMMFLDTVTYLPDDILVKVDRASMGVSLEGRLPLLDHRVVELAWRLPLSLKIRDGQSKWLLRQILYKYVPPALIERPKMGFGVPIDAWLRGPLMEWAEALLIERRLRAEGFFNSQLIREKWTEHKSGLRNWHYYLWDVLMFQAWLDHEKRN